MVVGAGPAGATAALLLARSGYVVSLIDRDAFPRDKPCGDLVGADAVALLKRLRIELEVLNTAPVLGGAFVFAPRGRRIGATVSDQIARRIGARVVRRVIFDSALVAAALDAGARFVHARVAGIVRDSSGAIGGVRLSDGTTVRAPLTIGADGWASVVARAIVRTPRAVRDAGVAVRTYAEGISLDRAMRFYIGSPGDGYGWIFPLGHGIANVGLGCIRGEPGAASVHAAFARFLERPELRGARELGQRRAWPIPFGWRGTPVSMAGALLAGDAASLASSLSGSGIHTAIASGALAAGVVDNALRRHDVSAAALRAYDRRLTPIANRLRWERWLHGVAGTPEGSDRAIALANAIPGSGPLAVRWLLTLG